MSDDLLDTVSKALALHDEAHHRLVCECVLCDPNTQLRGWLRSLLARCREAETTLADLRERHAEAVASRQVALNCVNDLKRQLREMVQRHAEAEQKAADLTALRQRHAADVEAAFKDGWLERGLLPDCGMPPLHSCAAAWLASEAKARLT